MVAPLKVGIAGLGTVGAEVVRLIEQQGRRCLRAAGAACAWSRSPRVRKPKSATSICAAYLGEECAGTRNDPGIDCLVELMGGSGDPALSAIEAALKSGKSVVTANKALIANTACGWRSGPRSMAAR